MSKTKSKTKGKKKLVLPKSRRTKGKLPVIQERGYRVFTSIGRRKRDGKWSRTYRVEAMFLSVEAAEEYAVRLNRGVGIPTYVVDSDGHRLYDYTGVL